MDARKSFRVAGCLLALCSLAVKGRPASWEGPAFLDSFDSITVWLPEPSLPSAYDGKVSVSINGRSVPVAAVLPGEPAPRRLGPDFVSLPGSFQTALGGREWDPASETAKMTPVGPDVYELVVRLPPGRYEYKLARGGTWGENFGKGFEAGGANIELVIDSAQIVRFVVDFRARTIRDSVNQPKEVVAPDQAPARRPQTKEPALYHSLRVRIGRSLTPNELWGDMSLRLGDSVPRTVVAREVLSDRRFVFSGNDLGSRWSPRQTTFKVWSPVAASAELLLFRTETSPPHAAVPMRRGSAGVWYATVSGDLHGRFYQYRFRSYGKVRTAADINGFAASVDSKRSMVVDLRGTDPPGWPARRPFQGRTQTDAVLYELHIRDFTVDPASGVSAKHRGKYLGLTEKGTTVADPVARAQTGFPTGLDYLRDLGVTHVHLLPFQDFSFDRTSSYGWGYETTLFNVPEEQYAVDRLRPEKRIAEVKQMVAALQRQGIGVVMDVVYNHSVPSEGEGSAFWQTVPYYYFRTNDRGDVLNESGVGNALNDDRPMVRKFIRDSLRYWSTEYRIDGFRFDLLGMFSPTAVRELALTIRSANPWAVVYGEPWSGGGPLRSGYGDQRGTGVGLFNDRFRSAFRGELDGTNRGFAMGGATDPARLRMLVSGSIDDFAASPSETVNYVSAHDNLTLWDRVARAMPDPDLVPRERAVKLALASVLLSQGVPFLEGGVELGRTKGMNRNSYDAGDAGNRYDWVRARGFAPLHQYAKGLIALRQSEPALRLATAKQVRARLRFVPSPQNTVAWTIDARRLGGKSREVLVILHGSLDSQSITLPSGDWAMVADPVEAGIRHLRTARGSLDLEPLSAYVLRR